MAEKKTDREYDITKKVTAFGVVQNILLHHKKPGDGDMSYVDKNRSAGSWILIVLIGIIVVFGAAKLIFGF